MDCLESSFEFQFQKFSQVLGIDVRQICNYLAHSLGPSYKGKDRIDPLQNFLLSGMILVFGEKNFQDLSSGSKIIKSSLELILFSLKENPPCHLIIFKIQLNWTFSQLEKIQSQIKLS